MTSKKNYLDTYLGEVFKQFIAIKDNDYKKSQDIFSNVFEQIKQKMGVQCNYFKKYCSQILFAGSVYDGIKVSKLDEFDMDLVIRLPVSYEDGDQGITIQTQQPGFIAMQITHPFDNLDKQPEWEKCHKVTREWRDDQKYLLQSKFRQWMHGIVQRAVNDMQNQATVEGRTYQLTYREAGPAFTLNIRHDEGEPYSLDVDLVPVIRFFDKRWPEGYRTSEQLGVTVSPSKFWLVVPKPDKGQENESLRNRCWRLSFQEYERDMIKDCQQLKMTIRLVKKLRDRLEMKAIASYYIKTLFLWKVHEMKEKSFWQKKVSFLYQMMVQELYSAIKKKNIPYFWHEDHNLIENLKPTLQKLYSEKLKSVLDSLEANHIDKILRSLLTTNELTEFKQSDFYLKYSATVEYSRENSTKSVQSQKSQDKDLTDNKELEKKVEVLTEKLKDLTDLVLSQAERIKCIEMKLAKAEKYSINDELNVDAECCPIEAKMEPVVGEMVLNLVGSLSDTAAYHAS